MLEGKKLKNLLPNIKCTECGKEFSSESVDIVRHEEGLLVLKIKCYGCKKCFGMAYLGLEKEELENALPDAVEDESPINYDDVLDAHHYFKNIDENWQKFLTKDKKIQ